MMNLKMPDRGRSIPDGADFPSGRSCEDNSAPSSRFEQRRRRLPLSLLLCSMRKPRLWCLSGKGC